MDTRTTSADFYPGGKTPVTAGGGITSGEAGGAAGEPMVPVTKVEQLPEHYRESDMRSKINELARVISGGVAAIIAMVSLTLGAEPVKVLGAKKDALWNDDFVVTNVVADFAGFATTNTVTGATNALAATFERGLEVATNAVLQAGAKEIAAATNALSQSVDERLRASTNGSFSASSLEPYAKRTWVEGQGYLKSTNLTGYAQVNWVQNQGFIKKEDASGEIARIVNEKIAAQDETAAYRLMSADGSRWIDGTGVCWRVRSHVCIDNGAVMSSDGFVQEWQNEETSERVSFSDDDGIRTWEYCNVLTWCHDPDDPNSTWQTVEYIYGCETNLTAGTAILGLKTDNPWPDQNGVYPPERVILEYWLTTNAVTRLATTNDMPKVDLSGTITTNDVCAIVTNTVPGGWNEWVHGPKVTRVLSFFCAEETSDYSYWVLEFYDENERCVIIQGYGDAPKKEDVSEIRWTDGPSEYTSAKSVRQRQPSRNALGLAMAKDLEKLPTHETVTNIAQGIAGKSGSSRVVYYVTTNTTINVDGEEQDPFIDELFGGIAFDLYKTNAAYFIDGDIPTLKLLAPHRRSAYFGNQFTAIEIGDDEQLLRTHILQADGGIAVPSPENIRFMGTLNKEKTSATALSLADYLEAAAQTVQGEDVKAYKSFTVSDGKDGGDVFKVTKDNANFMDSLTVKPNVGPFLYYESAWDKNGVPTNFYGFAATNAEIAINGNLHISDSIGVSSNVFVWGNLVLNGWDRLYVKSGKETDVNAYHGYQESLGAYVERLVTPLVSATNEYAMGKVYVDVISMAEGKKDGDGHLVGGTESVGAILYAKNKRNYLYRLSSRLKGGKLNLSFDNSRHLDVGIVLDLTANSSGLTLDVGTWNFEGMGESVGANGAFKTIYSNVEPVERTETVLRSETNTYENWIWDDESGDYILDPDEPYITEVYEWLDEYTFDMVWQLEAGTCWQFDFKQAGPTAMKVDVQRIYKTQPYSAN